MAVTTFENGLRSVCVEKPDSKVSAVVVHITGGCQSEKSNQSGLSEYVTRLLLCGTKNYPTKEALEDYAKLNGIVLKTHASREAITISAICANEVIERAVELLSEIVFDFDFDAAVANKVKNGLLADIERLSENYAYTLERSVNQALFYRTGLANPKFGTTLTVERFNAEIATDFMKKLVTPRNTILSVTGNIMQEEFDNYIEDYFVTRLPEDVEYKKIKFVSDVEEFTGSLRTRNKRLNQSRISIAFPTVGYKSSKKYLPVMLEPILQSKITKALRLSNYYNTLTIKNKFFANNGKIQFDIAVDYENAESHIKNFVKILHDVVTLDSVSEEEFELEKNIFLTKFMYKYEDCLEQSLINAKEVAVTKHSFNENSEKLKIEMLTNKDANKFIAEIFDIKKMFVSYLGHSIETTYEDLLNI